MFYINDFVKILFNDAHHCLFKDIVATIKND